MSPRQRVSGGKPPTLEELIEAARQAHESIRAEPSAALHRAFEAGEALLAAKAQVPKGGWTEVLASTGIPASTARLYMQLAKSRDVIIAAGCTSIREARRLLSGSKPRGRRESFYGKRGRRPDDDDRYQEGYTDGYRAGRADGSRTGSQNGSRPQGCPLSRKDVRWLIKKAHPDLNPDELAATRVTTWLNDLLTEAKA